MIITFVLPTVGLSGGARVVAVYAKGLAARGHRVVLVSTPMKELPLKTKVKAFVKGQGWPSTPKSMQSHLDGLGLDHRILGAWRPIVDADVPDADVVIATWFETAEWVHALHERKGAKVYLIQGHEIWPPLPVARAQATYRLPMHKIVVSKWLKDIMREQYGDTVVDLVPNSVDRSLFFSDVRGKGALPTMGLLYTTAATPQGPKGMDVALQVLGILRERVQPLRVLCFGSAHPGTATPLPKGVEFLFRPSQAEIRDLYARCDVWFSASRSEGFNLTAMEAMACRTPVVATRTGWPAEAIQTGTNGVLVDVEDVEGLVQGAQWVLSLPDADWRRLSLNAFDTVAHSSWEASVEMFERALEHACRRSKSGEIAGKCEGV